MEGNSNIKISHLAHDSRKVKENGIFVAITGFAVDGHDFIEEAIAKGARVIIFEKNIKIDNDLVFIQVRDSRRALAKLSANFYSHPSRKMNLIGITGTNGKTSITYFIKSILDEINSPTGVIGSIGTMINDSLIENQNTTPESLRLQEIFNQMVISGVENCVMEVSSHALSLDRVAYSDFNMGVYTNLTPDHLELHNSMDQYFEAKTQLFALARDFNIINVDDKYGKILRERIKGYRAKLISYGIRERADIYATNIKYRPQGSVYTLNTPRGNIEIQVNLPGDIYIYNSLAAISVAYCMGISLQTIRDGVMNLQGIKGRLEVVYEDNDYKVIVDFAHTEDGLKKALTTIRPFVKGRLILVFGVYAAPGKKGIDKRRAMGKVAARYADFSVITSDNPKEQDPNQITGEIAEAMDGENGEYTIVVDRAEAIKYAIESCEKNDVILLAGKGHETSQVVGKEEIPFVESEIVMEVIKNSKNMKIG